MATNVKTSWECGKGFETDFWKTWVQTKGAQWPKEFADRMNPDLVVAPLLANYLFKVQGTPCVLDVGAGPATCLGKVLPDGRRLAITAIDPLADNYDLMFRDAGVMPPVPTLKGEVEKLTDRFPENTFDLVHMRNALDHSYDPLRGLEQMVAVVKPGGVVILGHYTNEAEKADYVAFHQWNICVQDSMFVMWNKQQKINISERLNGIAKVTAKGNPNWTTVILEKF